MWSACLAVRYFRLISIVAENLKITGRLLFLIHSTPSLLYDRKESTEKWRRKLLLSANLRFGWQIIIKRAEKRAFRIRVLAHTYFE